MKKNYKYKCFVRSTSNVITKKDMYQISLPPHVWKKMGWKINENLQIDTIKTGMNYSIIITKEDGD